MQKFIVTSVLFHKFLMGQVPHSLHPTTGSTGDRSLFKNMY